MTSSGLYAYAPTTADLAIECFDRLQMRRASLTVEHLLSAQTSFNLIFKSRWANRGVNLWKQDTYTIPMVQGVAAYSLPSNTIMVLPGTYRRTYLLNAAVSVTPSFAASINSDLVTVNDPNHGLVAGQWASVVVQVSVGGLIISGFYQVQSVPDVNNFVIQAASNATSTETGGTVPSFTTTASSTSVSVNLPSHGLLAGQGFNVPVAVSVGGLTIQGAYTVATVTDANNFTITSSFAAGSSATVSENSGQTQIAVQNTTAQPTDILLFPLSRDDYAGIPAKSQQAPPTSYWYEKLISPVFTTWPVADSNGPYELIVNRLIQIQDVAVSGAQTPDVPDRFLEAMCADATAHLAMKWAPARFQELSIYAKEVWTEAANTDREDVPLRVVPSIDGYYQ